MIFSDQGRGRKRNIFRTAEEEAFENGGHKLTEDVLGEMVFDLTMARQRLTGASPGVLVPIVTTAVSDENASALLDLANQIDSLHAICISATLRTPGMCPPLRSSNRSFRFS